MFHRPETILFCLCISLVTSSYISHGRHGRDEIHLKLMKLAILVRHGDRSPYMTFPSNPYPFDDVRHWPDGPDQLTISGKKRMFDVGRFIRHRYASFLSTGDPIQVYARSSPSDRCLNSASLLLAGAFPPKGRQRFHPSLRWQPIPVHTEKDGLEKMLNTPSRSPCPALKRAKELQRLAPDVIDFEKNNTALMQEISFYAGIPIVHLFEVDRAYDPLITAKEDGKRLPDWATEDFMERVKKVQEKTFCVASSTPLIQKLETGLFWNDLKHKFTSDTGPQKVFIYSTHDARMSSFLKLVSAYKGPPKYGTSLMFELFQNLTSGQQVVRVNFLDETWSHKVTRVAPMGTSCDRDCDVDTFFQSLREFTIEEDLYDNECASLPQDSQVTGCFS